MSFLNEPLSTDQLFGRTKQRRQLLLKRQAVVLFVASVVALFLGMGALEPLEFSALDTWFSRPQSTKLSNVVLLPISEKSIRQIGEWPWPSFRYAVILELLERFGARSVYFESSFSEAESEENLKPLVSILEKKKMPIFFSADYVMRFENTGPGLAVLSQGLAARGDWVRPVSEIAKLSFLGHRRIQPDRDRVFRFWQPWLEQQGMVYPMVALKILMEMKIKFEDDPLVKAKETILQLIPWNRSRFENWPRVEFADLMQSYLAMREGMKPTVSPQIFKGRDVFIGLADESSTLSGLTPWGRMVFPVEITAMIYDGLSSSGPVLSRLAPDIMAWVLLGLIFLLLELVVGLQTGKQFWVGWLALILVTMLVWMGCALFGIWLPFVSAVLFLLISAAAIFVFDALNARQERSALFHLATRDGLTNLYVIRHFRIIMNQMTREACSRKEALAVILMDIDYFKNINDRHGHPAGDMVLKKVAEVIQSAVRQKRELKDVDFVARYGGEEFIVLVRRNSLKSTASKIAERIRSVIEKTQFEWQGIPIHVTMSLGVAALGEKENVPDPMVHRADKALYSAKRSGRNRVCTEE